RPPDNRPVPPSPTRARPRSRSANRPVSRPPSDGVLDGGLRPPHLPPRPPPGRGLQTTTKQNNQQQRPLTRREPRNPPATSLKHKGHTYVLYASIPRDGLEQHS